MMIFGKFAFKGSVFCLGFNNISSVSATVDFREVSGFRTISATMAISQTGRSNSYFDTFSEYHKVARPSQPHLAPETIMRDRDSGRRNKPLVSNHSH